MVSLTRRRLSPAGCKPYAAGLMRKVLIFQTLDYLPDENTEERLNDQLSFYRTAGRPALPFPREAESVLAALP